MSNEQKESNWNHIQGKIGQPLRRKNWLVYPLTATVFGLFVLIVFLNVGENQTVRAPEQNNPMEEYTVIFEGHEPFMDISHLSGSMPNGSELSVAAGYLYRAADFLDQNYQEVNPIKSNKPTEQFLDDWFSDVGEVQVYSAKTTWVYLNSAKKVLSRLDVKEQYDTEPLVTKIDEWIDTLEQIHRNNSFEDNLEKYQMVVEELTYLVRAIQDITPESVIYVGNSDVWDLHLQHIGRRENSLGLEGENYLLTMIYKENTDSEFDGVGRVSFTVADGETKLFSQTQNLQGIGGTYPDFVIPKKIEDIEETNVIIEWGNGEKETIQLNKEVY